MALKCDKKNFVYLPINKANHDWELYLTGAGTADIMPGQAYPSSEHPAIYDFNWQTGRTLPDYQIIIVSSGKGVFESIYTGLVEIQSPSVILLFPDIWHRYKPTPEIGWTEHWVSINGSYLQRLAGRGIISPSNSVFHVDDFAAIQGVHSKILDTSLSNPTENSIVLASYVMELLALVLESGQPVIENNLKSQYFKEHNTNDQDVSRALDLIWNHNKPDISVEDVADYLSVSRRTLERKFKKYLDATVNSEINRCRVERAKRLLEETNLSVERVAFLAGFSNSDRLRILFKQILNLTPTLYRNKYRF